MYFDPIRNAYIDMEDGSVVLQETQQNNIGDANSHSYTSIPASNKSNLESQKNESAIDDNDLDIQMMIDPAIIASQKMELERIERSNRNKKGSEKELYQIHPVSNNEFSDYNPIVVDPPTQENSHQSDWLFARALQAMEFEISNEQIGNEHADFDAKEYSASRSCKRQMLTLSTFICIIQIALMIAMVQVGGWAPRSENPMVIITIIIIYYK